MIRRASSLQYRSNADEEAVDGLRSSKSWLHTRSAESLTRSAGACQRSDSHLCLRSRCEHARTRPASRPVELVPGSLADITS